MKDPTIPSEELRARLDAADSEVRGYVTALEQENSRIQRRVVKLEATNVSQKNKIAALEEECEECRKQIRPPTPMDVDEHLRSSPALRDALRRQIDEAERAQNGKNT